MHEKPTDSLAELQYEEGDEAPERRESAQDVGEHVEHEERSAAHLVQRAVHVEDDGEVGGVVAHAHGVRAVRVEVEVAALVRPLEGVLVPEDAEAAAPGLRNGLVFYIERMICIVASYFYHT